jgi:hypothetical protein
MSTGNAVVRAAVADAVLALLTGMSARTGFLVVVDETQWLGRGTAGALGAVARRVAGTRVGVLAAVRTGAGSPFDPHGLPGRELGPLSDADAEQLVADACPRMVERVPRRVVEAEDGNPLAPVKLPRARATLSAARETFVRLCAQPWVYRTDVDLPAFGAGGSETVASSGLTAQEHEVATLAARGSTNRHNAERQTWRPARSASTSTGSSRSWGCSRGRRCATLSTPLPLAGASASGGDGHGTVSVRPAEGQA